MEEQGGEGEREAPARRVGEGRWRAAEWEQIGERRESGRLRRGEWSKGDPQQSEVGADWGKKGHPERRARKKFWGATAGWGPTGA